MKELTRSQFFGELGKGAVLGAGFLAATNTPYREIVRLLETNGKPIDVLGLWEAEPTFDNLTALSVGLRGLIDKVTPKTTPIQTQQDVTQFNEDISPYFLTTGILQPQQWYIPDIKITDYLTDDKTGLSYYENALADSQCSNQASTTNRITSRLFPSRDKFNSWSNNDPKAQVGVITASIAHEWIERVTGIETNNTSQFCNEGPKKGQADQDTYAQVASATVLAAMFMDSVGTQRGNVDALAGTLYQFKRFAQGTLLHKAFTKQRWDVLDNYVNSLPNPEDEKSTIWELKQQWYTDESILHSIDVYDRQPYLLLREAFKSGNTPESLSLAIPRVEDYASGGYFDFTEMKHLASTLPGLVKELG